MADFASFLIVVIWVLGAGTWALFHQSDDKRIHILLAKAALILCVWPVYFFAAIYESHEILREIYDDAEESDAEQEEIL